MSSLIPLAETILKEEFIHHIPVTEKRWIAPLSSEMQKCWQDGLNGKPFISVAGKAVTNFENPIVMSAKERLRDTGIYRQYVPETPSLKIIETAKYDQIPAPLNGLHIPFKVRQITNKIDDPLKNEATLFDDNLISHVSSDREKIALRQMIGGMLTAFPPSSWHGYSLILGDVEKNEHAYAQALELGIHDLDILPQRIDIGKVVAIVREQFEHVKKGYLEQKRLLGENSPNIIDQNE
jgi:hypothetical protein